MHERPWTKHENCWDFEQRQDSRNEKHEYNPQNIRDFEDMDEKMMNINSESHRTWKAPENKNWQSPSALAQKLAWQTHGKTLTNVDQAKLQAPYLPLALGPYENGSLKLRRCVFNKRAIWFPLIQNQEGFSKSFATVTPTFKATISAWCVARCMMLLHVFSDFHRFCECLKLKRRVGHSSDMRQVEERNKFVGPVRKIETSSPLGKTFRKTFWKIFKWIFTTAF